ncbi:MAG TPA: helix-turn-helix domain-containing protein [Acidimicrobiia bacterium]
MAMPYRNDRPIEDLSTRARIRDAAMIEFADKGSKGATMKSIATAAGVSVGLVQHHFGTKDGLRAACEERVLDLVRFKTDALEAGSITDPQVLSTLMSMGPQVQRYVGRALVEDSPGIRGMVDDVMSLAEFFLNSHWPERFPPKSQKTRDAAAVMTAINVSTMVMQSHLARRMHIEPFSEEALNRIGVATFDVWETLAEFTESDVWRKLRDAIEAFPRNDKENDDD